MTPGTGVCEAPRTVAVGVCLVPDEIARYSVPGRETMGGFQGLTLRAGTIACRARTCTLSSKVPQFEILLSTSSPQATWSTLPCGLINWTMEMGRL